jgi:hypothetical protein
MTGPFHTRAARLAAALSAAAMLALTVGSPAFAGQEDDLVDGGKSSAMPVPIVPGRPWGLVELVFNRSKVEQSLNSMLKTKVDEVSVRAGLSPAQKRKLFLAGEGDIRRFYERVDQLEAKYRRLAYHRNPAEQMGRDAEPLLAARRGGLFSEDSLFAKTLTSTLTPEQAARYKKSKHNSQPADRVLRQDNVGQWQARMQARRTN